MALREGLWWGWWWLELRAAGWFVVSAVRAAPRQGSLPAAPGAEGPQQLKSGFRAFSLLTLQWVQAKQICELTAATPCFGVAGEPLKANAEKDLLQRPFLSKSLPAHVAPDKQCWGHGDAAGQSSSSSL